MKKPFKITGIILTGGKSTRLGEDKGLLKFKNKHFIEIAIGIISEICDEILISANSKSYNDFGYKTISDEIQLAGPIGGIYSCLRKSSNEHNIIIPVDMPFVNKQVYEHILTYKDQYNHVVALNRENLPEPLVAYYHRDNLQVLQTMINKNCFKLQEISKNVKTKFVKFDDTFYFYTDNLFFNVNTISDLRDIQSLSLW